MTKHHTRFLNIFVEIMSIYINGANGGSRDNIMKLIQQHELPQPIKLFFGIVERAVVNRGQQREELDVGQQELGLSVVFLASGLSCIGSVV